MGVLWKIGLATFLFAEKDDGDKRELDKPLREVDEGMSLENPRKEGSKDTGMEAAFKELSIQPEEGRND